MFDNPKFQILQEFLNTLYLSKITLSNIKECLNNVIKGQAKSEELGTENIMMKINVENTLVYDMFVGLVDDSSLMQDLRIDNEELLKIILELEQN